jgi:HD-GYP domain-containing protein (c-di-GMP phosphodiesterase class II)
LWQIKIMVAVETTDLIERAAAEAFIQLAKTTDKFERYDHPHAQRIATIADEIAKAFHLARHDRGSLRAAALLHDLGEVAMERDYIQATGPLSTEERLDLARHPVIGEREASRVGADRAAQLLVRWHHEWWNGAGYPDALRREEIPLAARILRVADSYASLTDVRPFRDAMTEEAARRELIDRAGIEFDPGVVNVFLSLDQFDEYAISERLVGI